MSLNCHCYTCNVKYPTNAYISSNNEDEQNIIIQICKRIFEAIQHKHTSTEISYDGNIMLHRQIRNIIEVENFINKEFNQLFEDKILRKEMKKLPFGIWRIGFQWNEFDNDFLIKNILKISRKWCYNFIKYFQRIDDQKRKIGATNSYNPDKILLNNLKFYLLGFEYLIDYSWKSYDDDNCYEGNFIFASDSGIFIVVEAKWLNVKSENNYLIKSTLTNDVKDQSLKYKEKVSIEFNGKYVALIGATFTMDDDKATFDFIDHDEIIAKHIKEIHEFSTPRYDDEFNELDRFQTLTSQNNTTSVLQGTITKITAAAAVGYIIYRAFSRSSNSD
ncbi:hypothetical protein RclHR1_02840010 [Rhizophagus clarus]|uniref:Uncharacterized protein n=1 Tax=Rhizophagus clarus TaxID=94130 RepID=A0A2Z6R3A8_9GLOM|nr:hypothetical protein RclHR1_02840010 [Rhizophagus clarus]GES95737.1 hypothetical protein GLOIN_2v1470999 [Rhizophagus clarus]